eukprot:4344699-Alexandrium_andersonii.AAC.1
MRSFLAGHALIPELAADLTIEFVAELTTPQKFDAEFVAGPVVGLANCMVRRTLQRCSRARPNGSPKGTPWARQTVRRGKAHCRARRELAVELGAGFARDCAADDGTRHNASRGAYR